MIKYLIIFIVFLHGLIHFMGFAKAFGYGKLSVLSEPISKQSGAIWFLTAVLFITAIILFLFKNDNWSYVALIAVISSQILIIMVWSDAKYGSIANLIILIISICAFGMQYFERQFRNDVNHHLQL